MKMLSHYTNRQGLEGILKTETIWATHFLDLNDSSEYFYAWDALACRAAEYFYSRIPEEMRPEEGERRDVVDKMKALVRATFASTQDSTGNLYVTSFARARNEDQERRGILTLWDRYTKFEGYCLQFPRDYIERMLQFEMMKGNYISASLIDVVYGIDENSVEFKTISDQLGEFWLLQAERRIDDGKIRLGDENSWAPSYLFRKIMEFCARHKDPCFEDEREVRLFFYPAEKADVRIFTGIAGVKKVQKAPSGKRFIEIGEFWRPGIIPNRIIIGPRADDCLTNLLSGFWLPPTVEKSNLPVV